MNGSDDYLEWDRLLHLKFNQITDDFISAVMRNGINSVSLKCFTPLKRACQLGLTLQVQWLLAHGATPNDAPGHSGMNALQTCYWTMAPESTRAITLMRRHWDWLAS